MSRVSDALAEADSTSVELRRALDRALRDLDKAKTTKQDLIEAVYRASRDAAAALTLPPVPVPHKDRRKRPEVAVVMLSDWQLGKRTPTYNSDVCEQRIARLAAKVASITAIARADHPVRACHVWNLGDLAEGELMFPGQAHRIDASLFRQVSLDGPRILSGFLRSMLATFETVSLQAVDGNHTFGGIQRRDYHPDDSADRMIVENAKLILAGEKRITWPSNEPDGERNWYAIDRIGNYSALLFHGNQIRGGFAGFPWYGAGRFVLRWYKALGPFTEAAFGHFHTLAECDVNGVTWRANGTTESTNTYALEEMAACGRPMQRLLFVEPEAGMVTASYPLWLDGAA